MAESQHTLNQRYETCLAELARRDQAHVLRWWDELSEPQRAGLLTQLEAVPWDLVDPVLARLAKPDAETPLPHDIRPAQVYPTSPKPDQRVLYDNARKHGIELLSTGKVAVLMVAGGQGTRLGIDGPKGIVPVTPVAKRTLFELFAGMVFAARQRYGVAIPWYIMTSPSNHEATVTYFQDHEYFGLPPSDVVMFQQGMLPAFDLSGRLLVSNKDQLALEPDGHGGSLKALAASGSLADLKRRGAETISYFQVDNPLVKPFDPLFIGLHATLGSEMSTKVTAKADDHERVGNVCTVDGRTGIVEYSEFPAELAAARNPDGSRKFDAGNLAIHLLDVAFVDRIVGSRFQLPIRQARKVVPFLDEDGHSVQPSEPNGLKLESFVFDALPLADQTLVLEVERAEEFSPVKNATGVDSLETAIRAQNERACRWLERVGCTIPRKSDGTPDVTVDIAPTVALDAADLDSQRDRLPHLKPGDVVEVQ